MRYMKDYTGCKVIIHDDEKGTTIADTTILQFDRSTLTISVDNNTFDLSQYERVSLLIIHKSAIYEYMGNVRKQTNMGLREISLFKGQIKEDRTATRYTVNTPAQIERLIIANRTVPLRKSLKLVVINISTDGVLIRTQHNALNVGTSFQLKLNINGDDMLINSSVKRINCVDTQFAEYGCTFDSINTQNA